MTVFYRKYRPQKLAEIDSLAIYQRLEVILSSGRAPHAFLFTGPKGTGKTSAARIIAKSVNCERNNGRGEPCGKCPTCLAITKGTNLDVLEIDAASNRGIDEIRDLREKIKLAPAGARKKVYIIDEVHMLTTEAFNALLKTLEEPPEHVIFVLCTTLPEKLPETIISRCLRINFKRANFDDLLKSLKRAQKGEKREIDQEALSEIASLAEGSYRDAHKLLEQVLTSFPRAKITAQMVKKALKEEQVPADIFDWIVAYDAKKGLEMVSSLAEKGADFKFLTQLILETLHAHLLKRYGVERENFSYNPKLADLTPTDLQKLISLFSRAGQELRTSPIPQLPLELAIIEWCEENATSEGALRSESALAAVQKVRSSLGGHPPRAPVDELGERWEEILAAVKPLNHSVAGLLRSCRPVSFDGKTLTIEAFYKFHFERLSEAKVRDLLEKVFKEIFGRKIEFISKLKAQGGVND